MSDKEFVESIFRMFDVHESIADYTDREFVQDVKLLIYRYQIANEHAEV